MKPISLVCIAFVVILQYATSDPVGKCPSKRTSDNSGILWDSQDLSIFYLCTTKGNPVKFDCPPNLYFDIETRMCCLSKKFKHIENAENLASKEIDESGSSESEDSSSEEDSAENLQEATPETTTEPTSKPTDKPEPTDKPTVEPTNEPTTEPTTEPTNKPTVEPTTESTPESTTQPPPETTFEPTTESTPKPTNKPTEEPTNEPTNQPTTESPLQQCSNDRCPAQNGATPVFFAHPESCERYCMCDWGTAYDMPCPDGLHFNTNLNVCDWPSNAGCQYLVHRRILRSREKL